LSSLWLTVAASIGVVVLLLLWRVWPLLAGRARPGDERAVRLVRWNRYLLGLLRKHLDSPLLIAQVGFFAAADGQERSLATWSLAPTLIPDVEFLALAGPAEAGEPAVVGFCRAADLRTRLGDAVQRYDMWGHTAWIYDLPADLGLDALASSLMDPETFRRTHGAPPPPSDP
jgi:hypothetical protein